MCECVCRTQNRSDERKCEQVNPLLAGLQHQMEASQPLVVLDTRYLSMMEDSGASAVGVWSLVNCLIKIKTREHGVEPVHNRMIE